MTAPFRAWPYAALAVVNWLYETPSLFCWVVFRHPMNQDVKPPLNTWIVDVDGVPKTPAASAWVDEWTLLLTVTLDGVKPDIVYVEYDGPHQDLITTWSKQWEPWGPILATSFQVIPSGIIVMWHGALVDVPPGWALCNGENGTPDLKGRFVMCQGAFWDPGDTGGSKDHVHDFISNSHYHYLQIGTADQIESGLGFKRITTHVQVTGTTYIVDHLPPYYVLAYIMKT